MVSVARLIRTHGGFLRRRDLLALGCNDARLRAALAAGAIFRVRHGWYATPDARDDAVRAVRIGGRLTGISALRTYGIRVPVRPYVDIAVPRRACRLRSPNDRRRRLDADSGIRIHWTDLPRSRIPSGSWRVSPDDALVEVLSTESRDIAIACCSAVARYLRWSAARMDAVFARCSRRAQSWRRLVSWLDDSHGETFVRLWLGDAGVPWESQPRVTGVGRLDGRVSPNVYIEIDGAQHDPSWSGDGPSSYVTDHDRDALITIAGGRVLRYIYRQLYADWPRVLAAIRRAREDDLELIARRQRHPVPPRSVHRKRRSSARDGPINSSSAA